MIDRHKQLPISGCQKAKNFDMVPTAGAMGTVSEVITFAFAAMQLGIIPFSVFSFVVTFAITHHISSHRASALRIRALTDYTLALRVKIETRVGLSNPVSVCYSMAIEG